MIPKSPGGSTLAPAVNAADLFPNIRGYLAGTCGLKEGQDFRLTTRSPNKSGKVTHFVTVVFDIGHRDTARGYLKQMENIFKGTGISSEFATENMKTRPAKP